MSFLTSGKLLYSLFASLLSFALYSEIEFIIFTEKVRQMKSHRIDNMVMFSGITLEKLVNHLLKEAENSFQYFPRFTV